MATSFPSNPKFNQHVRSDSLPSNLHPLMLQCNEQLSRLTMAASDATAIDSPSPSSFITFKVTGLQDLHDCVGQIFQLPLTQQAVEQSNREKWVDELLDGSLRLLDACTASKDAILHTKECARELQSTIRRRRGGTEMEFEVEVRKYMTSRKAVRKAVQKALGNLRVDENKNKNKSKEKNKNKNKNKSTFSHKEHQIVFLVNLLKEVETVTVNIFGSFLSFVSGPANSKGKGSSWSLVSKLMNTKRVTCTQLADENEFTKVDSGLQAFLFMQMPRKLETTSDLQNRLEDMESRFQDLEEGLEILFKRLIRNRVSLLNILNH